jgi:hypothetical protein
MSSEVHHLRLCVLTATHMAMSLLATAALSAEPPTASAISKALASQRDQIKSGIVTFRIENVIDSPNRKASSQTYTVYFKENHVRVDEVIWYAVGGSARVWKLYTPSLALKSFPRAEDSILLSSAVGLPLEDTGLGIIDPRTLGLRFRSTESLLVSDTRQPNACAIPSESIVEPAKLNDQDCWKLTAAIRDCQWMIWVSRAPIRVLQHAGYNNGKIFQDLVCDHDPSPSDLSLPTKLVFREYDDTGQVVREEKTTVEKQSVNVQVPDEDFHIGSLGIPPGRSVVNLIDGSTEQVWDGKELVNVDSGDRLEPARGNFSAVMGLSAIFLALCAVKVYRAILKS